MSRTDGAAPLASLGELGLDRRRLLGGLGAFAAFALVGEARAVARRARTSPEHWVTRQNEIARALATGELRPVGWMDEVERLAAGLDIDEFMAFLGRQQVRSAPAPFRNDPAKRFVRFVDAQGQARRLEFGAAFFDFQPHNVITPHGHRHMVSAHLVVQGAFRVRNFDRVGDEEGAMLIRPTRDYTARVGDLSAMSSERDNIHWFVPVSGPATTFDVVISDLDEGKPSVDIKAIDPLAATPRGDGVIRAPIIGFGDAARKYTAHV